MKSKDTTAPNFSNTKEQLEKSSAFGQNDYVIPSREHITAFSCDLNN